MKIYARLKVTDNELTLEGFTPRGNFQFTNEVRVPITDPYIQPLLEDNKDKLDDYLSDFYQVTDGTQALSKGRDVITEVPFITEVPLGENYLTYQDALELILEHYKHTRETHWYVQGYDPLEDYSDLGMVITSGDVWGLRHNRTNGMTRESWNCVDKDYLESHDWRILVPKDCDGESWEKVRGSSLDGKWHPVSSPEVQALLGKLGMTVAEVLEAQGGRL